MCMFYKSNEGKHDDNDYYLDYHYRAYKVFFKTQLSKYLVIFTRNPAQITDDDKGVSLLETLWRSFNVVPVILFIAP